MMWKGGFKVGLAIFKQKSEKWQEYKPKPNF